MEHHIIVFLSCVQVFAAQSLCHDPSLTPGPRETIMVRPPVFPSPLEGFRIVEWALKKSMTADIVSSPVLVHDRAMSSNQKLGMTHTCGFNTEMRRHIGTFDA